MRSFMYWDHDLASPAGEPAPTADAEVFVDLPDFVPDVVLDADVLAVPVLDVLVVPDVVPVRLAPVPADLAVDFDADDLAVLDFDAADVPLAAPVEDLEAPPAFVAPVEDLEAPPAFVVPVPAADVRPVARDADPPDVLRAVDDFVAVAPLREAVPRDVLEPPLAPAVDPLPADVRLAEVFPPEDAVRAAPVAAAGVADRARRLAVSAALAVGPSLMVLMLGSALPEAFLAARAPDALRAFLVSAAWLVLEVDFLEVGIRSSPSMRWRLPERLIPTVDDAEDGASDNRGWYGRIAGERSVVNGPKGPGHSVVNRSGSQRRRPSVAQHA